MEPAIGLLKLSASRVEGAGSSWSALSIAKGTSNAESAESRALMAVSRDTAKATSWTGSFIELNPKEALKRVSTQIEMESPEPTKGIRVELERNDSEVLHNVTGCRIVLRRRNLLKVSRKDGCGGLI